MADGATVRGIGATSVIRTAPYPGARPFLLADQDRFFGRDTDSKTLLELWQDNRVTLLTGPVASGKTSLLNAGVLPLLKQNRTYFLPVGRISYGSTFARAALPEHNPFTLALLQSWSPGMAVTELVDLTIRDFIQIERERQHGLYGGPLLAAIDQVDDLLTDPGPRQEYRKKFLEALADAVLDQPGLHLLLAARDEAADLISKMAGGVAVFNLTALTRQDAIEAITGPTAGTGRSFADGSAERLVIDLQSRRVTAVDGAEHVIVDDSIEPALLQVICEELWSALPPDTQQITERDVRLFADVDTVLAAHCSAVIAAVADDHDLRVRRLRTWLLDTFVTELGLPGMAYEGRETTAGMPNAAARALKDCHLLSSIRQEGARWYKLLSARLIEPLRQAVDTRPPPPRPAEHLSAAERALTRGELDTAERYALTALRSALDEDLRLHAEIESLLGNIAVERERPAEAESHYRAAAYLYEAMHDNLSATSQLAAAGQTLVAQDRLPEAVSELHGVIGRMPGDPVMQTDLALALWRMGESQAAISVLTSFLVTVDGGSSVALRARGEILADLGEAHQAISDLDRVTLEERPSSRAARGLALAELGDQPRANIEVDNAVAEAPRNGAVLLYAARAKALSGDEYAAKELARRAVDAKDLALSPHQRKVALQLAARNGRNHSVELFAGASHQCG